MAGSQHYQEAERLAAKAHELLGRGKGQDTAAVGAAVVQVHAALAAATAVGHSRADELAWADVAGTKYSSGGETSPRH